MLLYESAQHPFSIQYPAAWAEQPADPQLITLLLASGEGEGFALVEEDLVALGLGDMTLEEYVDLVLSMLESTSRGLELISREPTVTAQGLPAELLVVTVFGGVVKGMRLNYLHDDKVGFSATYTAPTDSYEALQPLIDYSFGTFRVAGAGPASIPSPTAMPDPTPTPVLAGIRQDGRTHKQYAQPPLMTIDPSASYTATIRTNQGEIVVELLAGQTPETVNNFVFLTREGFYDGTIFHRVIEDFMIQGGDPTGTGAGGPGYTFEDEILPQLVFNRTGALAMANAGPDTNGSQFFITVAPAPHLDGSHTIFGRVISGQGVVDSISSLPTGAGDRPVKDVVIEGVVIGE